MQRCLIFLFLLISSYTNAQHADIRELEFSLRIEKLTADNLPARARLRLAPGENASIDLVFHPAKIHYIRLREGRLKQNIPFERQGQVLRLQLSEDLRQRPYLDLEIAYDLSLREESLTPYLSRGEAQLAFNILNLYSEGGKGEEGMFYPGIAGDKYNFLLNLSLPSHLNSGAPGELEFVVKDGGSHSHFWRKSGMSTKDFYLLLGRFREFEAEDIEEVYELNPAEILAVKVRQRKVLYRPYLQFLEKWGQQANLNELLENPEEPPLIRSATFPLLGGERRAMEQNLALRALGGDSLRAAYVHYLFHQRNQPPAWEKSFWQSYAGPYPTKVFHWMYKRDSTAFFHWFQGNEYEADSCVQAMVDSLLQLRQPPRIKSSYHFKNGQQYIYLQRDTAISGAAPIPLKIQIFQRDSVSEYEFCRPAFSQDTIAIALAGSPMAVKSSLPPWFPATLEDQRPEVYNLYILNNAESEEERQTALSELLQSANANLKATAIGIALSGGDGDIRWQALQSAMTLPAIPARRLQPAMEKIAADKRDEKAAELAQKWLAKYYGDK